MKMQTLPKSLSKRHVVILLLLIAVDMLATMVWFAFAGIGETNPVLVGPIEHSLLSFVLVKLAMSLPGLLFLFRQIKMRIAQIGLVVLLGWYTFIFCIHWYILMCLLGGV